MAGAYPSSSRRAKTQKQITFPHRANLESVSNLTQQSACLWKEAEVPRQTLIEHANSTQKGGIELTMKTSQG